MTSFSSLAWAGSILQPTRKFGEAGEHGEKVLAEGTHLLGLVVLSVLLQGGPEHLSALEVGELLSAFGEHPAEAVVAVAEGRYLGGLLEIVGNPLLHE